MADNPSTDIAERPSPEAIRDAVKGATMRARDLAASLNVSEAQLLAAQLGQGVTRIDPNPDRLIAAVPELGRVMALTRNESVVSERHGTYRDYRGGEHASMVLGPEIDLRIFPQYWQHGFAVEAETKTGFRRSFQIFDAAGDAVHKIYLPQDAEPSSWNALRDTLTVQNQSDSMQVSAREPVEDAIVKPERASRLREEWDKMTDTHQFLMMVRRLKINRLGANRMAGAPYARPLAPGAVATMLDAVAERQISHMMFVGNRGCIQIQSGRISPIKPVGPWLNVLHPDFNLHLRGDHIAEVWAVNKPTRRGPAISVEAFDSQGGLIMQFFGHRSETEDHYPEWTEVVDSLPELEPAL